MIHRREKIGAEEASRRRARAIAALPLGAVDCQAVDGAPTASALIAVN
jgi:hypothetical protein